MKRETIANIIGHLGLFAFIYLFLGDFGGGKFIFATSLYVLYVITRQVHRIVRYIAAKILLKEKTE